MKTKFIYLTILTTCLLISSCKSGDDTASQNEKDSTAVVISDNCNYKYDNSTTKVSFTAYKFTNKTGVGGKFDKFTVSGATIDKDPLNVIQNLTITIPTSSVNTGNEDRDKKINTYFFGVMNVDTITGKVIEINATDHKTTMMITMNGKTNMVIGDYTFKDNTYSFNADINVNDWEAIEGIDSLNQQCKELHTGKDGISKLWPDVSINFSTTLQRDCK